MSDDVPPPLSHISPGAQSTVNEDFPLDNSVATCFPPGTKVLSASKCGHSAWTTLVCITVELPDGVSKRYFLKRTIGDAGQAMFTGEFCSMTELYKTMPTLVPKPIAWGKYEREDPATYFFLCEYVDLTDQMPDPDLLCTRVAELHRISVSPTGKFGFHVRTCNGKTLQATEWDSSWTAFFSKLILHVMRLDIETNGPWKELEEVEKGITSHVIPRLIGALETEGRSVKPCLIHGDLWEGNAGTLSETGAICLFDAGSFYGHNELEIGYWRGDYNQIQSKVYRQTYWSKFGPSEPKEEWNDRNLMYSAYYDLLFCCNAPSQGNKLRQTACKKMSRLVKIYTP